MERTKIAKVINRARYDTEKATLIADDVYWDGHNFERSGRNQWLYKTRLGAFFLVASSFWQGEDVSIAPLTLDEAISLYEGELREHAVSYEEAFEIEPSEPEPEERGRPTMYGEKMVQTGIWLPREHIDYLKSKGTISEQIRAMIVREMQNG